MRTPFIRVVTALFPILLLSACTVGKNYRSPDADSPAAWHTGAVPGIATNASTAIPSWLTFNDPQLESYLRGALEANYDVRIAGERIREARSLRREAGGRNDPQLGATGKFDNSALSKNNERLGGPILRRGIVDRETDLFQFGFDASWELDLFGATRRTVEAANARLDAVIYERDAVTLTVLAETARTYLELRGAQQRMAIVRTNISYLESTLKLVREKFEAGLSSELPVIQTRTLLETIRAQLPTLEANVQSSAYRLAVIIGQEPGSLVAELSIEKPMPVVSDPVPVGLPSEMLRRRPDIQRAEREIAAASAETGAATAELLPRFYLTGTPSLQSSSFTTLFNSDSIAWTVGPAVEWKILTGGRVRARINAAKSREAAALLRYERAVLTALEEVETALVQYGREQQRRAALQAARQSSERSVEIARTNFTEGLGDFLNVLEAERSRNDIAEQLVQSDLNVARHLVALLKSLGGDWEKLTQNTSPALSTEKP